MALLLLTRPQAQSDRFLAVCREAAGRSLPALVSPLTEVVPTGAAVPAGRVPIFTSGRAVELAGDLSGRVAWCVGARTAELASAAGADTRCAGGDVESLFRSIPRGDGLAYAWLRGEDSRGALAERLRAAGVDVVETVLYRAEARALSVAAHAALAGAVPVAAPVFSPRGAAFLAAQAPRPPAVIIAISPAAGAVFAGRTEVQVAERPDQAAMRDLVLRWFGNLP